MAMEKNGLIGNKMALGVLAAVVVLLGAVIIASRQAQAPGPNGEITPQANNEEFKLPGYEVKSERHISSTEAHGFAERCQVRAVRGSTMYLKDGTKATTDIPSYDLLELISNSQPGCKQVEIIRD